MTEAFWKAFIHSHHTINQDYLSRLTLPLLIYTGMQTLKLKPEKTKRGRILNALLKPWIFEESLLVLAVRFDNTDNLNSLAYRTQKKKEQPMLIFCQWSCHFFLYFLVLLTVQLFVLGQKWCNFYLQAIHFQWKENSDWWDYSMKEGGNYKQKCIWNEMPL